jgi:general secretion pathway protein B
MSYILDALKKAEQERGLSEAPKPETIGPHPKRNNTKLWVVLGIIFLCLPVSGWVYFLKARKEVRPPAPKAIAAARPAIQSPLQAIPNLVPSPPVQPVQTPELLQKPVVREPDTAVAAPLSGERLVKVSPPLPALVISSKKKSPPSLETKRLLQPNIPARNAGMPSALLEAKHPSSPKIPSRNVDVPSFAVQASQVSLSEALARMNMSIHLYSENTAERRVFINGKTYIEGESLEPGIILENITPEGAVLRSGEERAVLRLGSR